MFLADQLIHSVYVLLSSVRAFVLLVELQQQKYLKKSESIQSRLNHPRTTRYTCTSNTTKKYFGMKKKQTHTKDANNKNPIMSNWLNYWPVLSCIVAIDCKRNRKKRTKNAQQNGISELE